MRRKPLLGAIITICLVCSGLLGVWQGYPILLNMLHGQELEQALQHYWDVRNDSESFLEPIRLSEVMTGDYLTTTVRLYSVFDEPHQSIPCQVTINSVKEYSAECSRIQAEVWCGSGWGAYSSNSGQYILLYDNGHWKVADFWKWTGPHKALWPDSPPPTCADILGQ